MACSDEGLFGKSAHTRTPLPELHHDWPCQVKDLDLEWFGKTQQDCQKEQAIRVESEGYHS